MARPKKIRLGDLLVQQGLLDNAQLSLALDAQKSSGRKLGRIIVEHAYLTEEVLSQALSKQLRIPFVDLVNFTPEPECLKLLSEAQARRFRAVALEEINGVLRVGFADPTDLQAYDELAQLLQRDLDLAVVTESQLLALIDRAYHRSEEIAGLAKALGADLAGDTLEFGELLGTNTAAEEAPVVKLLQTVFEEAFRRRASDIHIEPQAQRLRIRFRIDGVLHVQTEADVKIAPAMTLRLKLMAGLDISEKRLPQDGRFDIRARGHRLDVRLSSMPTQYGESVVMRLLNQNDGILTLDRLGMPTRILERLSHHLRRTNGMILVTGPTGSGKTTTLYAALSHINSNEKKIITVEDPVEYRLPGINQVQIHEKIDLSFGRVLRSALRQDPDIVLVGEMRDAVTAEIGMRAAITGHMVLSTLHTNDVISTPIRLLDMQVPAYMVSLSLQLVIAQRLVRLICQHCATPYTPNVQEHAWLSYELGRQVDDVFRDAYRYGRGCMHCSNTGFHGRAGVYEMLEMTDTLIEALNKNDTTGFVARARQQMAGETLRRDAVRLVTQGRTTIDEAMRISHQNESEYA
ncbi:MAG: GspE/PulE family protein [Pseudomonadota bacterium]